MEPLVSIIVPVYNAEEYLKRCVDSILTQEYPHFELFLMDDGSTDQSGRICDAYAEKDARVRVTHKENSGVSDTRNRALALAEGKYLQFLDSDDWMTRDATSLLVQRAESTGCDLVIADFYRVIGERVSRKGDVDTEEVLSIADFAEYMLENPADFYYGVLWNKLYRREILEKRNLQMDTEMDWAEDFKFNLEYLTGCQTVCALKTPIYYYVKRKGSLVNRRFSLGDAYQMKTGIFEFYDEFYRHILSDEEYEHNSGRIHRFFLDIAGDGSVAPTILPNSQKLGRERIAPLEGISSESGVLARLYLERKRFEQHLESFALKYRMSMTEADLLYCLWKMPHLHRRRELQEITGFTRSAVFSALQKLTFSGYISSEDATTAEDRKAGIRKTNWVLMPAAQPVLLDFSIAESEFLKIRPADAENI